MPVRSLQIFGMWLHVLAFYCGKIFLWMYAHWGTMHAKRLFSCVSFVKIVDLFVFVHLVGGFSQTLGCFFIFCFIYLFIWSFLGVPRVSWNVGGFWNFRSFKYDALSRSSIYMYSRFLLCIPAVPPNTRFCPQPNEFGNLTWKSWKEMKFSQLFCTSTALLKKKILDFWSDWWCDYFRPRCGQSGLDEARSCIHRWDPLSCQHNKAHFQTIVRCFGCYDDLSWACEFSLDDDKCPCCGLSWESNHSTLYKDTLLAGLVPCSWVPFLVVCIIPAVGMSGAVHEIDQNNGGQSNVEEKTNSTSKVYWESKSVLRGEQAFSQWLIHTLYFCVLAQNNFVLQLSCQQHICHNCDEGSIHSFKGVSFLLCDFFVAPFSASESASLIWRLKHPTQAVLSLWDWDEKSYQSLDSDTNFRK